MAHIPSCSRILRLSSFRISAGDRSSRYPRGWCGSSTLWTPSLISLGLATTSRPQQETDLWIGHNSLPRSLIKFLTMAEWLVIGFGGNREWAAETPGCYNSCPRRINVVEQLRQERNQAQPRVEQLGAALKALSTLGAPHATITRDGGAQATA